jgi:hypothetical protein
MINRINAARAGRGLPALAYNQRLSDAALGHAQDISRRAGLSSANCHTGSDGSTIIDRQRAAGYYATRFSEIVGWGFNGDASQMMAWWLASPPHANTIFNDDFTDVGIAYLYAPGSQWGHYWVVEFGAGGASVPEPPPPEPPRPYTSYVPVVTSGGASGIDLLRFKLADPDCWRVVRHPDGQQEDVQDMELGGGLFVRRKGGNGEWHRYDSQFFYLVHDTSPAPGTEGVERVYTLYKSGQPGAPKSKRYQAVGEEWNEDGLHTVTFRAREGCRPLGENSGQAKNHSTITRHERNYTFNTYGQNLTFDEVVWEQTGVETQIYGRKDGRACGWIGWAAPWGSSEPVEIHWNRGRLTQEPKRICGF